jgi:hypothetical protein
MEYQEVYSVAVTKFAISVPEEVMKRVDQAARKRRATRSGFISEILRSVAEASTDAQISERINRFFSDPNLRRKQRREAREWARAVSTEGTEW